MIDLILASTILIIGDSHSVGPFGWQLDENFRKHGYQVAIYASCGAIGKWWSTQQKTTCGYFSKDLNGKVTQATTHPTPKLSSLLSEIKPEAVIVELGSNYVKMPSDETARADIKALVKQIKISGASCFWISAPDMRLYRNELPRLNKLIKDAVGEECKIFNSQSVTSYPSTGGDGIHYWSPAGTPIARSWADAAFESFKSLENLESQ